MTLETKTQKARVFMMATHTGLFEGYGIQVCNNNGCFELKSREDLAGFIDKYGIEGYLNSTVNVDDNMFVSLRMKEMDNKIPVDSGFGVWIESQRMLMNRYNHLVPEFAGMESEKRAVLRAMAIMSEAMEIVNETPWKWWKNKKLDKSKMLEELADIMHFIADMVLEIGSDSDEFMAYYLMKNAINVMRQEGLLGKGFKVMSKTL